MTDSGSEHPLDLVPLPGSERPAAGDLAPASVQLSSESIIEATIIIRRRAPMSTADVVGTIRTSAQLATEFGADPADVTLVEKTLSDLGLRIVATDAASRRIRVAGTISTLSRVFGTSLSTGTTGSTAHRVRTGGLSIPKPLAGVITAVLGLDNRPQARAQFRIASPSESSVSYTPPQLGELYRFPTATDGTGQTIAIIELGGGFEGSDLDTYFAGLGIARPTVKAVGIDGAVNEPGKDPSGADGEVLLDIEVAGALAPAASLLVYFAPNTDDGFVDAVATAAHATPAPTAMSISWGQSEDQWTAQARTALDDALLDAVALGVTVTVAAGDNGSSDGASDSGNHADFPASSPHALACGGTSLRSSGDTISSETVWNDGAGGGATGGGVSDVFGLPDWQQGIGVPSAQNSGGRGVPDVAGNADPETGYAVLVDGTRAVYGGTSAVAPLWAALVARLAQANGAPFGLLQPRLYPLASGFRDITSGNNGAFAAQPGWDACTGLGTPNGTALAEELSPKH
jgi:kumamolisin